ncbi:hypothetical protein LDENG_00229270 [Lucifuga dentata]|nr:hypothetical protein LDENG_00229270 [Lucifuga dentata]
MWIHLSLNYNHWRQQVITFLHSKDISVDSRDIEACHTLPRKNKNQTPVIRFVNRKQKYVVIKQGKKLKGSNVYIIEHLTKKNADIAKQARNLRKQNKIQRTWMTNCRALKLNDSSEESRVIAIKEMEDLNKYK